MEDSRVTRFRMARLGDPVQPLAPTCRQCRGLEIAALTGVAKLENEVGRRQGRLTALWPLDQQESRGLEQIRQTQPFEFFGMRNPVEIQVVRTQCSDLIGLHEAVGRTLDAFADTQRAKQSSRKCCLAGELLKAA